MIKALALIYSVLTGDSRPRYTYGEIIEIDGETVRNKARVDNKTGDVEFVLWKKGEQGHKEDFWHRMGDGWITRFRSY